eukprot:TRINITY_DN8246_c0_g1_i2.p1 TRINITY_DN8246_c0_g1~~TRINITY_DN8246_c0_g1_i2.p1  ORF type:complete len:513 (-),score=84.57 TRINITY_DN8246_c0_g1_i2:234-1772(-)
MARNEEESAVELKTEELNLELNGSKGAANECKWSEIVGNRKRIDLWKSRKDRRSQGEKLLKHAVAYSSCRAQRMIKGQKGIGRCVAASFKAFIIGAGLKGGLALFNLILRLKRKLLSPSRNKGSKKIKETGSSAWKETFRYGLFLGAFAGTFTSIDESLAALLGRDRGKRWRTFLAGALAGPSLLLTGFDTQHNSLAVYILMRAAVLASRCGIKSEKFGFLCKPLTWKYGDVFLMCLSSSQILYSHILKPETLPPSYRAFLLKHGDKNALICEAVKELAIGKGFTTLEELEKYYKGKGMDVKLDPSMKLPCSIIHGNQSCHQHTISFFFSAIARSLPVYLPVYLIPALIVHRQRLLKRPVPLLVKTFLGTARSTLFLSVYTASGWMWPCIILRIIGKFNVPLAIVSTFPTGLALFVEKKSRRMEIALFCFARALESFFGTVSDLKLFSPAKKIKRPDVILFSLSTAVIMHCYANERDVFRSKYLNVLDWVFGDPNLLEHLPEETKESLVESV